ncbi:MAG: B12-binding domain-containing protein [Actinomycetota bacterium]
MTSTRAQLRIGELGRRVGVSPELLRAWERRYGLMERERSAGGFRLYSDADAARVQRMQKYLGQELSAAEAARAAIEEAPAPENVATRSLADSAAELQRALERYDEQAANSIADSALSNFSTETALGEVVMPVLRAVGERWAAGELTIAQEHFATNVLRGRLLGLARGWGHGNGPTALLACTSGERHDLPLMLFGISLRAAGWRIVLLGADIPALTIEQAAESIAPAAVAIVTTLPEPLLAVEAELAALAARVPVAIGGRAADAILAERVGAILLEGDPASAAATLADRLEA